MYIPSIFRINVDHCLGTLCGPRPRASRKFWRRILGRLRTEFTVALWSLNQLLVLRHIVVVKYCKVIYWSGRACVWHLLFVDFVICLVLVVRFQSKYMGEGFQYSVTVSLSYHLQSCMK